MVAILVPNYYGLYQQLVKGIPWGDNPVSDKGIIITTLVISIVIVSIILIILNLKLITKIDQEGIWFRMPPFLWKWKFISKDEIEKVEVRIYNLIKEYGGWGIPSGKINIISLNSLKFKIGSWRYGSWTPDNGGAYNVKGNIGIQLYLKNGKKILIGTQQKTSAEYAMKKMMETQSNDRLL